MTANEQSYLVDGRIDRSVFGCGQCSRIGAHSWRGHNILYVGRENAAGAWMMDRRTDINSPDMVRVPFWGPDWNSVRMAFRNLLFANPFSPANIGVGVRPAPSGASESERTKSTTWFAPQQNFRGFVAKTTDPTLKNVKATASLPSANTQINPVLLTMSQTQLDPYGGWL